MNTIFCLLADTGMSSVPRMTNISISFPNWFWVIISVGVLGAVFYLGALHNQLKQVCGRFPKIHVGMIRISELLLQKEFSKELLYEAASPMKLTDAGKVMMEAIKFEDLYKSNYNILIEALKKASADSEADIEEVCKMIMLDLPADAVGYEIIKEYSYKNGIPIQKILFAAGIALRDKLIEEAKKGKLNKFGFSLKLD
jgi:hypothetical protein